MDKTLIQEYGILKDNFSIHKDILSVLKYGTTNDSQVPILSIVIPTYKREKSLDKAIDSVYSQLEENMSIEIIVVDNDFFDLKGTEKEKILNKYDQKKLRYYQNTKNIGLFGNWNRCLSLAKGRWIAMLHDDDLLCKGDLVALFNLINSLPKNSKYAYIHSNFKGRSNSNIKNRIIKKRPLQVINYRKIDFEILGQRNYGIAAATCGTLFNKELIMKSGGYNENFYPSSDMFFPLELVILAEFKVGKMMKPLGEYIYENNVTLSEVAIIGDAYQTVHYLEYYKTIGKISKQIYRYFKTEILYLSYQYCIHNIDKSNKIKDKESVKEKVSDIIGDFKKRPFHLKIYLTMISVWTRIMLLRSLI